MRTSLPAFTFVVALATCTACSPPASTADADAQADAAMDAADVPMADAQDVFDAGGPVSAIIDFGTDTTTSAHFYDIPFPSDLRLTSAGTPDFTGFPHPANATILTGLLQIVQDRAGWPVLPIAYFRFSGPLAPQQIDSVIPAAATSPILLVDIDATSPERGHLVPVVAFTPGHDAYLPDNVLSVAPRPGFVLHPHRTYAVVVLRSLNDIIGRPLEVAPAIAQMASGMAPSGSRGAAALAMYQPMFATLQMIHVDATNVADATVFTTGDVVADTAALTDRVLAHFDVTIDNLAVAPSDTANHPRFCQLIGNVNYPQFQTGTPPFATGGTFQFDASGLPVPQTYPTLPTYARAPITLTLPRSAMPAAGYPLTVYFHGSGGVSTAVVDRGTWAPESPTHPCTQGTDVWNGVTGCNTPGQGPAYILSPRGFATAGSALPVNPERLPGASETAYLNLDNLAAFRDTFRQGVIEQRLFIRALSRLHIPQSVWSACTGVTLPSGTTEATFDTSRLVAQGQSMGGMYTNLISATEPMVHAAIPTGAGGYWGYFILQTQLVPGVASTLSLILATASRAMLTFHHPALFLLETAWEPAEPFVYMPRIARHVLPGHPVRPIYEPAGQGDSYFPTVVYDGAALAYGHQETGTQVWPTMQPALMLDGLDGVLPYPVTNNRHGDDGTPYTGAIVQYMGDGVYDPHALYSQLDAVKYQYSCFAWSYVTTGTARILDPTGRTADSPCM